MSNIIPTSDLNILIKNVDKGVLVLYDINETLITYPESRRLFRAPNTEHLKKMFAKLQERYPDQYIEIRNRLFETNTIQLSDPKFTDLINKCKEKDTPFLCFTAIRTGLANQHQSELTEDKWVKLLADFNLDKQYNVNFSGINEARLPHLRIDPTLQPFMQNNDAMIKDGIVFCNNINKGYIIHLIMVYLEIINKKPHSVIMLDNRLENLVDVDEQLKKYKIPFIGIYYTKIIEEEANLPPIDDDYIDKLIDELNIQ